MMNLWFLADKSQTKHTQTQLSLWGHTIAFYRLNFCCLTLICDPQLGHQMLHLRTNLCCLCQNIRYQQHIIQYRHAADADAHLSYSSCPPCLQRGAFLCVISGSMLMETDGRTERGLAHQHKSKNLPLLFSFLLTNVESRCWPLVWGFGPFASFSLCTWLSFSYKLIAKLVSDYRWLDIRSEVKHLCSIFNLIEYIALKNQLLKALSRQDHHMLQFMSYILQRVYFIWTYVNVYRLIFRLFFTFKWGHETPSGHLGYILISKIQTNISGQTKVQPGIVCWCWCWCWAI